MYNYCYEELKKLISECLRERPDSYPIQQLFDQFPTTTELMDVSEQQLMCIKGIGIGKARQLTAMLKLAKTLTVPTYEQTTIRSPKDAFDLLEPDFSLLNQIGPLNNIKSEQWNVRTLSGKSGFYSIVLVNDTQDST
ncbi:hypothetical protein D3P07_12005 [Paenibacillus sp. 1011MAR3C5]|uniref:hypothetical protein n=1 Tax=Paenibacillus sp. 1011MAR3C5 TaxID=1675787 RepID=UPI000E6B9423|nr:hypothetical protein [Paenibacillus sp. 1011MAR3C5]RJE88705.1 hypothetical protein D3P07_12005 [Paenibacillus sp. 1011MAR3C5]